MRAAFQLLHMVLEVASLLPNLFLGEEEEEEGGGGHPHLLLFLLLMMRR